MKNFITEESKELLVLLGIGCLKFVLVIVIALVHNP